MDGCKIEFYDTLKETFFDFMSVFGRVWLLSLQKVLICHQKYFLQYFLYTVGNKKRRKI
jgi:hypothetical protein